MFQSKIEMLDGWKDVEEVVYHLDLSYVPIIIRIELTSHFGIEKFLRTHCHKRTPNLQSLPISTHRLERYQL